MNCMGKPMTGVRILIYAHCLVASFCVVAFFLTAFGWRLDGQPLDPALEAAIGGYARFIGWLCFASGFFFPVGLVVASSQVSGWRRAVVIVEDVLLSLVQLASILFPIRVY
jgi:hypothetical protein